MRSIVRNLYKNFIYRSSIDSVQTSNFLIIGYFYFSQTITVDAQKFGYVPIIALGVKSEFYNFLNLYFTSDTQIQLRYIHDENNIRTQLTQNMVSMKNKWIGLGIAFSQAQQLAKIIYTNTESNPQLKSSSSLSSVILPSRITKLDVSISSIIDSQIFISTFSTVFENFAGDYQSVKIIYDIDFTNINSQYFYRENIDKSSILSKSFDINAFQQNSEYDLGKGFVCNTDFAFFEGICISKDKCQNLVLESISYSSFESGKFYDPSTQKCLNCSSNCESCSSLSECSTCRYGYILNPNKICIKCDNSNSCINSCPNSTKPDPMNQTCVNSFNQNTHQLSPLLLSGRIFNDNDDFSISPTLSQNQQITFCYIDIDNNPFTFHSFLGGIYFTQSTILSRSWTKIPKGYQKKVTFYALFYGSDNPSKLKVMINQQEAILNLTYSTIIKTSKACSQSDSQTQSIYLVEFSLNDIQNKFDLEISSQVDKWGLRNVNIQISKCHPSCNTCYDSGSEFDCASCNSDQVENKFSCTCKKGYFVQYNNCFDTPCTTCQLCSQLVQNCIMCEDITGKCTLCNSGYKIKDGICIQDSLCTGSQGEIFEKYCGVRFDFIFEHFKNNKIVQYGDYWKFYNNNVVALSCLDSKYLPLIGQSTMHYFQMQLDQKRQYHYNAKMVVDVLAVDNLGNSDFAEIYDRGARFFQKAYSTVKKNDPAAKNSCGNSQYTDAHYLESFTYLKGSDVITIYLKSVTDSITNKGYSFKSFAYYLGRCHPMCKDCVGNNQEDCMKDSTSGKILCVDNAKVDANKKCICNDGFYFSLDRALTNGIIYPGKCLNCNPSCKKCNGPSYQDCTECAIGYYNKDNVCQHNCVEGQYWDSSLNICKQCDICCRKCTSIAYNCHDCRPGYQINLLNHQCVHSIFNTQCVPCAIAINSLCGGDLSAHVNCQNNGWSIFNSNHCVQCGNYVNGNCGGEYSQAVVVNACIQEGYYNYNSSQCSSCSEVYQNKCGRDEIQNNCLNNGWLKYNASSCMNCNPTSLTLSSCKCDQTCKTCTENKFFNPTECTSCSEPLTLFQKECLPKCPNGYTSKNQICVKCSDKQMPQCFTCYKTCLLCEPFEISENPKTCKTCTNITRELVGGECVCKDNQDQRQITFECSYQNVAVIEPILSNSDAILSINFQIQLIVPDGFTDDTYSLQLCQALFQQDTLLLFGTTYQCKIKSALVYVEIDKKDAAIFQGDLINFKKNVLGFSSLILIDTFYNNLVVQETFVQVPNVIYNKATEVNSCNDIQVTFEKFENTGERGLHRFSWSISQFTPEIPLEKTLLQSILDKFTKEQKTDIVITKGIIKPNAYVSIRLDYLLKVNVFGYTDIPISVKIVKKIRLEIKSPAVFPLYKFQGVIIIIQTSVIQCDTTGIIVIQEPVIFSINSIEYPQFNYSNQNYNKKEYRIEIAPFILPAIKISINVYAKLVSNSFIEDDDSYILDIQPSQLDIKILGGNGYFSYKNRVELKGEIMDRDLPTEEEPQGIDFYWKCEDPGNSNECKGKLGEQISFPSPPQNFVVFESNTFNPYTVIKLSLKGQKIDRENSDSILVLFSELDLPSLNAKVGESVIQSTTINLNEEIYVELKYQSLVNVDILSYSGTIVYKDEVVGVIIFDYYILRFQIWNYFSDFKRGSSEFLVRFNVFNPKYYMPSIILMPFNINFPPNNCKFTVLSSSGGYSLESKFLLQMEDCEDDNEPIQYQFYFYKNEDDFGYEKRYPKQIKRRQLTDQQDVSNIVTSLPNGKLLLMAQAIDQKQAIYNQTLSVEVQMKEYNENDYLLIIQQKLDSVKIQSIDISISDLSILSDDILLRNQFKDSALINQKKIEIYNQLSELTQNLSNISTFTTLADKAKASLVESGIIFNQSQSVEIISDLIKELDESSNLQKFSIDISKEKLKQKLYDNFQVFDSLSKQEKNTTPQQKLIELQNNIGSILFKNMLPNENPVLFQGLSTNILSSQVTQKHVCSYFICEYAVGANFNQIDPDTKTNIYDIKILSQNENLYSNENSFQNYTNQLTKTNPNIKISKFPIITPSINDQYNLQIPSFKNKVALQFASQNDYVPDKKMACLSRINERWTNSGCQNYYNQESKSYTCICQQLSPTTIIEDLEDLLYKNNLNTSFSEEGLENISNFKEFYKYAVFYLLTSSSILFFILYYKGKAIDLLHQQRVAIYPIEKSQIAPQKKEITKRDSKASINLVNTQDFFHLDNDYENQKNELKNENKNKEKTSYQIKVSSVNEEKLEEISEKKKDQKIDIDLRKSSKFSKIMKITSPPLLASIPQNRNSNEDLFSKRNKTQTSNQDVFITDQQISNEKFRLRTPTKDTIENQLTPPINTELSLIQFQDDQSLTTKKDHDNFSKLNKFRQVFIFHNFLGIFFIYNPNLPRSLRFLVFYVRLIHSLAITVIFDVDYSIVQKIGVTIINAISLLVIIKVLEKIFAFKYIILKVASRIFTLLILGMYYYIILSIVSGQSPSQSNISVVTFSIFLLIDIFIVSSVAAICSKYLALFILKNKETKTCMTLIYKTIELQIILSSLR